MTLFFLNPFAAVRKRLGMILVVIAVSIACGLLGMLMAFVFAPRQALQANRISRLPVMNAADVESAEAGDEILITGVLVDNDPLLEGSDLVAYIEEVWEVTVPDDTKDDSVEPRGTWKRTRTVVPRLLLELEGDLVQLHAVDNVKLGGSLHEDIVEGFSFDGAKYEGKFLSDGSLRYRGLANGDLTTVLGKKAVAGGVVPEQLFAGDRVTFEANQRNKASGLLFSGIFFMIMAVVVLVGGLLFAVFR